MPIREAAALDVSNLPSAGFGHHEPLWWGVLLGVAIETTAFAILWSSYLYLRMQEATWPPWRWSAPDLTLGIVSTLVLLASAVPMWLMDRAAKQFQAERVRLMMVLFYVVAFIACLVRYWEFVGLQVKWDSNAYGSIVWAMLTMHTVHILSAMAETSMLTVYLFKRPLEPKQALDVEVGAVYWYFVVASWIPNFALLYLGPHILN
jgi:cytochrome c oxidase subunit III